MATSPSTCSIRRTARRARRPKVTSSRTTADLLAWASHVGLLTTAEARRLGRRARLHPAEAHAAFERTRETRAYLHGIFDSVARGSPPARSDLRRLQRDAADAFAHGQLVRVAGQYRWSWADDPDLERPLWPIIDAALTLVTDGPLDRVKGCPSCRFLFVDESKNRSRRWCSMDDCGAEDKMRKYVARRAAARTASRSYATTSRPVTPSALSRPATSRAGPGGRPRADRRSPRTRRYQAVGLEPATSGSRRCGSPSAWVTSSRSRLGLFVLPRAPALRASSSCFGSLEPA